MLIFDETAVKKTELLKIIRDAISKKAEYQPARFSEEEYTDWCRQHTGTHLKKGVSFLWEGCEFPGSDAVVVKKSYCRGDDKFYLAFENAERFVEYRRSCVSLGVSTYMLFENWATPKLRSLARKYGVSETAYEDVQNAVEQGIGLYFSAEAERMPDEQLSSLLCAYTKRLITQKTSLIYGKLSGAVVYIDEYDFDFLENPDSEIQMTMAEVDSDHIDMNKLLVCIREHIDKLLRENNPGKRFDMKDCLLPQVVASKNATRKFLSVYYSNLVDRSSLWRPISLAYQMLYAYQNGVSYLKNPAYISACGDTTMQTMLHEQIVFVDACGDPIKRINEVWEKIEESGLHLRILNDFAASPEQIGKSLSKELRTEDTLSALTRALAVSALEKIETVPPRTPVEMKGEGPHE